MQNIIEVMCTNDGEGTVELRRYNGTLRNNEQAEKEIEIYGHRLQGKKGFYRQNSTVLEAREIDVTETSEFPGNLLHATLLTSNTHVM